VKIKHSFQSASQDAVIKASAEARWRQVEVARLTAIIQAAAMKASRLADLQRDKDGKVIGCGSLDSNQ